MPKTSFSPKPSGSQGANIVANGQGTPCPHGVTHVGNHAILMGIATVVPMWCGSVVRTIGTDDGGRDKACLVSTVDTVLIRLPTVATITVTPMVGFTAP